ncbi:cell division topological specificity factor MinE [Moritella viscosa]|uniref:Cell division topological specificity factor n=1 Tax=Moritella viscosa TaxID=80854 RepID=A0A090K8Q8_9GAMM|nr:cell division topological specificity factor MinE [Moritella viscosa]CED60218.1 cell division topological specificity factor [Moritella viscosa]SGY98678.1 Cell division topological specificity factor [Moritella viscosa]SGZ05599.1 Cell division topological specificity factor [Moritella viscosa]SGZ05772.1 Cell division topological specificity factor [Moritella viscosa]SGZ12774.1 Cell division topological specificity factor [Moritella viscosa]
MSLLDYFRTSKPDVSSANLAKDRLQIIVAHERNLRDNTPDYLPQLKLDILEVIKKYVAVTSDQVHVQLDQRDNNLSVLELNVTLSEDH